MLSEEENKSIEIFTDLINYLEKWNKNLTVVPEDKKYYDTVLNLITKLQKENEHWKNGFERELKDNRKNTCELLKQDLIIREKDKQIDLMAKYIDEIDISEDICEGKTICDENCKNCIKQYFETKAKKGE